MKAAPAIGSSPRRRRCTRPWCDPSLHLPVRVPVRPDWRHGVRPRPCAMCRSRSSRRWWWAIACRCSSTSPPTRTGPSARPPCRR
eukprot:852213-Prymnesium_polylepis.1